MTKIILTRHGHVEGIKPERFRGREPLQLTERGAAEAAVLAHHPDETIVLVGHDSVNRALLLELLDQPLSAYWRVAQDPCCINEIDVTGGSVFSIASRCAGAI